MRAAASILVLAVASAALAGPNEALAAAYADAKRLPPDIALHARYLTTFALRDGERADFLKTATFHVNSLSREADFGRLVQVTPDVYRLDIRDYGWNPAVYERLGDVDPHFHVRLKTEIAEVEELGHWYVNGREARRGDTGAIWKTEETRATGRKTVKTVTAAAPWLNATDIAGLVSLTGSQVPIVRADWFFFQTAISEAHDPGYVDFLGVKNRGDFEKLVGLDAELSRKLQKEIRALLARSGVALNNRAIVRFQTITGGYWITLDSEKSTDKNNAVRLLDGDYQHDAEEIYGVLPNDLFALGAFAAKDGTLQKTVPDKIASDGNTVSNDHRIHLGKSCISCHSEGIRPIADYARKLYRAPNQLTVVDYDQFRRLQRLYLSDLESKVKQDQAVYTAALARLNGLTPAENARLYAKAWDAYTERDLYPVDVAREIGCTEEALIAALKKYVASAGTIDPVLAAIIQGPTDEAKLLASLLPEPARKKFLDEQPKPLPIRREHFDEAVPILYGLLKGVESK